MKTKNIFKTIFSLKIMPKLGKTGKFFKNNFFNERLYNFFNLTFLQLNLVQNLFLFNNFKCKISNVNLSVLNRLGFVKI